jgi:hypothetical protein
MRRRISSTQRQRNIGIMAALSSSAIAATLSHRSL